MAIPNLYDRLLFIYLLFECVQAQYRHTFINEFQSHNRWATDPERHRINPENKRLKCVRSIVWCECFDTSIGSTFGLLGSSSDLHSPHLHPHSKKKRSWSRAVFSNLQRKGLEKRFEVQKYVTKPDRRQLAAMLGLTDAQVTIATFLKMRYINHQVQISPPHTHIQSINNRLIFV